MQFRQIMDVLTESFRVRGFDRAELAEESQVSPASVYRYFKQGANPQLSRIIRVAEALGYEFKLVKISPRVIQAPVALHKSGLPSGIQRALF